MAPEKRRLRSIKARIKRAHSKFQVRFVTTLLTLSTKQYGEGLTNICSLQCGEAWASSRPNGQGCRAGWGRPSVRVWWTFQTLRFLYKYAFVCMHDHLRWRRTQVSADAYGQICKGGMPGVEEGKRKSMDWLLALHGTQFSYVSSWEHFRACTYPVQASFLAFERERTRTYLSLWLLNRTRRKRKSGMCLWCLLQKVNLDWIDIQQLAT